MTGGWRPAAGGLVIAGLAMMLAGCASDRLSEERAAREERNNVYPGSYRADLVAALHSYLNDPANIRDAWVAEPVIAPVGNRKRYVACVRFSARSDDGRYSSREMLAVFSDGRFDQFIEPTASTDPASQESQSILMKERCGGADYKRFPELEVLKR